jgi:hypothetical protein
MYFQKKGKFLNSKRKIFSFSYFFFFIKNLSKSVPFYISFSIFLYTKIKNFLTALLQRKKHKKVRLDFDPNLFYSFSQVVFLFFVLKKSSGVVFFKVKKNAFW